MNKHHIRTVKRLEIDRPFQYWRGFLIENIGHKNENVAHLVWNERRAN